MEKCPVCRAAVTHQTTCRRCKTDLSTLLKMESDALIYRDQAMEAFKEENFMQMFEFAKRSAALVGSPEARKLLAFAAVLVKRYTLACKLF
ncbi:hypothetical protein SAMN02746065_12455 [Desulfocicer vacuolatum DSM 3385]|uniref:Uncharacterized protein n=1 Tax=Desulfocicer vacuolatum DSM 3385 TaxID=1121400 RepID=A0A1W2E509_9BACT|nr:hypothetical protein [Desulfocicer vacuolatum]SMD04834.1 hypothetical protein SAMN02746065_12455 [Desulfocicer vacuolatum DSM 3385]